MQHFTCSAARSNCGTAWFAVVKQTAIPPLQRSAAQCSSARKFCGSCQTAHTNNDQSVHTT
jgi:hypothetical protein